MQAIIIHQFGDPKLLKVEQAPTPHPGAGEALVEIKAAGINPSDVKNVRGTMHGTTLPRIPGRDFAGVVVGGPAEWLGREVWGTGGDIGFTRDGSHAQYILLPLAALTPKPAALSMDAAGSAGLIFVTAWCALVGAARVGRGDRVLIVGASGGVGSAAVQIAASRGAKVIGGVHSDNDAAAARAWGADQIVNTACEELAPAVHGLTQDRGADVVFDTSGRMFAECVESAAHDGRIVVISAPPDGQSTFNLRSLYRKTLTVLGVDTRQLDAVASAKLLAEMASDFDAGRFAIKPGQPRPLSDAAEAYDLASQGKDRIYFRPDHLKARTGQGRAPYAGRKKE